MSKNTITEVEKKMKELQKKRAAELEAIDRKKKETESELLKAKKDMEEATERTDTAAYEKAKARKEKAESVLEMYSLRCDQIMSRALVSEKEGAEVLNSLRVYDVAISSDLKKGLRDSFKVVTTVIDDYFTEVQKIQRLYIEWSKDICKKPLETLPWNNPDWAMVRSVNTKIKAFIVQMDFVDDIQSQH